MTRYRLPDALGGGEIEAEEQWTGCAGADIHYHVAGSKVVVSVPSQSPLAEVPPPIPAEPPPGRYDLNGVLCVLLAPDKPLICITPDGTLHSWRWPGAWGMFGGPNVTITPLVPRDLPEVELPWRCANALLVERIGGPGRHSRVRVTVGRQSYGMPASSAREMANALVTAAGPDTEREA